MELVSDIDHLAEILRVSRGKAMYDKLMVDTVQAARLAGVSWERIGDVLGVSRQAAQQRYGQYMMPMAPLKTGPRKREQDER